MSRKAKGKSRSQPAGIDLYRTDLRRPGGGFAWLGSFFGEAAAKQSARLRRAGAFLMVLATGEELETFLVVGHGRWYDTVRLWRRGEEEAPVEAPAYDVLPARIRHRLRPYAA